MSSQMNNIEPESGNGERRTVSSNQIKWSELNNPFVAYVEDMKKGDNESIQPGRNSAGVFVNQIGETVLVLCLPADGSKPYLISKDLIVSQDISYLVKEPNLISDFGSDNKYRRCETYFMDEVDGDKKIVQGYCAFTAYSVFTKKPANQIVNNAYGDVYVAKFDKNELDRMCGEAAEYIDMSEDLSINHLAKIVESLGSDLDRTDDEDNDDDQDSSDDDSDVCDEALYSGSNPSADDSEDTDDSYIHVRLNGGIALDD